MLWELILIKNLSAPSLQVKSLPQGKIRFSKSTNSLRKIQFESISEPKLLSQLLCKKSRLMIFKWSIPVLDRNTLQAVVLTVVFKLDPTKISATTLKSDPTDGGSKTFQWLEFQVSTVFTSPVEMTVPCMFGIQTKVWLSVSPMFLKRIRSSLAG